MYKRQARQITGDFDKTFTEYASAKDADRPVLQEMLDFVREGDALVVHSIDRLARNLGDLERILARLNKQGVSVEFRKESLLFAGDDNPMQRLMLQMMGAFAQFERSMIRERQREGIAAAQAAGRHIGRPQALPPTLRTRVREQYQKGVSIKQLMSEHGVSRATVYRACHGSDST